MQHFQLKYFWVVAFAATTIVTNLTADTITKTDIRNKHRSMASGETTVFAQSEGQTGTNQSYRGGLGVNFPAGSSVRLLVAQRPTFERILPGEKITTTSATSSSGGYHGAPATTDGEPNSIVFSSETCSVSSAPPSYIVMFSGVVDSRNKDVLSYPMTYVAEKRATHGSVGAGGWGVASEGDVVSCLGSSGSLPDSCVIEAQTRFTGTNPGIVTGTARKCTCTAVGSCTITDI